MGNLVIRGFGIPDHSIPSRGFTGTSAVPTILPARGITLGGDVFTILGSTLAVSAPETFPGVSLSGSWSSATTGTGTGWTLQHHFGVGRLWDVHGVSSADVWTTKVGTNVYNWNGASWIAHNTGTSDPLTSVWSISTNDVWWAEDAQGLLHWNGSSFSFSSTTFVGDTYLDVWASGANDVWAIADTAGGRVINSTNGGTTWIDMLSPAGQVSTIWGTSPSDVWVGPANGSPNTGNLLHWNGSSWSIVPVSGGIGSEFFMAIFGFSSSDIWAVGGGHLGGNEAAIYHYNGSSWTLIGTPAGVDTLQGVWGTDSNNMWFGSNDGKILHWNGASLATVNTFPGVAFWGMWGFAAADIWLGGGDSNADVYHYNGTAAGGSVAVNNGLFLNLGAGAGSSSILTTDIYKNFDVSVLYQYNNAVEQFFPTNEIVYLSVTAKIDSNNYFTLAHLWDPKKGPEIRVSVTTSGVTTIVTTDVGHASSRALRLIRFNGRMQAYAGSVLLADFHGWRTDDVQIQLKSESALTPIPLSTKVSLFQPQMMVTFGTEIAPFVSVIARRIVGSTPAYKLPNVVEVQIHNTSSTVSLGEVFTYFPPLQLTVSGLEGTSIIVNDDGQLRDSTPTLPGLRLYD